MKSMVSIGVLGVAVVLAHGEAPVVVPQAKISGGAAIQAPLTHQQTFGGTLQSGTLHTGTTLQGGTLQRHSADVQPMEPPRRKEPPRDDGKRNDRPRKTVVIPGYGHGYGYGYYGGYYYGNSAVQDLADAEWAKVRLMEEELRIKQETAKMEYEAKMAELDAKKEQMIRQDQRTSWDRAVAMYPPLLDPKSKMRAWYDHLINRAQEMTDRWGNPIRVAELDAPDYPEIFAHRAAEQINLKPLPLPPPQPAQVAETIASPPEPTPESESPIVVDRGMPD